MSETLRKRGREAEALQDSIDVGKHKRFHHEETERFLQLLQLDETLSVEDKEEYTPNEELVNGIMSRVATLEVCIDVLIYLQIYIYIYRRKIINY